MRVVSSVCGEAYLEKGQRGRLRRCDRGDRRYGNCRCGTCIEYMAAITLTRSVNYAWLLLAYTLVSFQQAGRLLIRFLRARLLHHAVLAEHGSDGRVELPTAEQLAVVKVSTTTK